MVFYNIYCVLELNNSVIKLFHGFFKCAGFTENSLNERISFNVGKTHYRFKSRDVIRFEANGSYTCLHTISKEYLFSLNIKRIDKRINRSDIIRINRSNIINASHIKEFQTRKARIIMDDGKIVKIPRRKKKDLSKNIEHILSILYQLNVHRE